MPLDLTGGLEPASDTALIDAPDDPNFGENHAFWVFDTAGQFALLNCHLNTVPGRWEQRREAFSFVLPGERLLVDWAEGNATTTEGPGAENFAFRCIEPFVHWSGSYRGAPRDTTAKELLAGVVGEGPRTDVEFDIDLRMVAPPWVQGSLSAAAAEHMSGDAGRMIGGHRYEQLYRATATLRVDGDEHAFEATGLRTHRRGVRDIGTLIGHSWLTAVFPSGRAFGLMRFVRPDGSVSFSEGFVLAENGLLEARVIDSPWLSSLEYSGESFRIELATESGPALIEGETAACSYSMGRGVDHAPGSLIISHGMGRFRWEGEETYGLIERSAPIDKLE